MRLSQFADCDGNCDSDCDSSRFSYDTGVGSGFDRLCKSCAVLGDA